MKSAKKTKNEAGHVSSKEATFGDEVRLLRQSLGYNQDEFCRRFNIRLANLRNWEQDRVIPDSASFLLIQMIKVDHKRMEDLVAKAVKLGTLADNSDMNDE